MHCALLFNSSSVTPKYLILNIFSLWRICLHVYMKVSLWRREGRDEIFFPYWLFTQLCLILCDPVDCSLTGSSIHGIFQARILEWVAISFSNFRTKQGKKKKNPSLTAMLIYQKSQFMSFFSLLIWLFHAALTSHLPFQHCYCLVISYIRLFGDLKDCSPPGFSVHGICQTRILEWTAILFSTFDISESKHLAEDEIFRNLKKDKMYLRSV